MLSKTFIQVGVGLYSGGIYTGRILKEFYSTYILYISSYKLASKIQKNNIKLTMKPLPQIFLLNSFFSIN